MGLVKLIHRGVGKWEERDSDDVPSMDVNESIPSNWNFVNGVYERNRSFPIGEFQNVAYNAANFTPSGGTWTVESGDQKTYQYALVGKILFMNVTLDTTSITGGPIMVQVNIPGGYTSALQTDTPMIIWNNSVAVYEIGIAQTLPTGTALRFWRPGNAAYSDSVNNTYFRAAVRFGIE